MLEWLSLLFNLLILIAIVFIKLIKSLYLITRQSAYFDILGWLRVSLDFFTALWWNRPIFGHLSLERNRTLLFLFFRDWLRWCIRRTSLIVDWRDDLPRAGQHRVRPKVPEAWGGRRVEFRHQVYLVRRDYWLSHDWVLLKTLGLCMLIILLRRSKSRDPDGVLLDCISIGVSLLLSHLIKPHAIIEANKLLPIIISLYLSLLIL